MHRWLWLIGLALALLAELPLLNPPPFGLTDHLIFWKAGQLALSGGSPYDLAVWADAQRTYASGQLLQFIVRGDPVWVYPAWSVLLFIPFGLLPYPLGPWVLHLSYLTVGIVTAILFVRLLPERWHPRAELAIPLVAIFQPYVIAARDGQFGSFLLLGVVLVFMGLRDGRASRFVCGALVLFVKPQLFLALVPVTLVLLVRAHAWRTITATTASLAVVAVVMTARYPESVAWFTRGASDRADVFTIYSTTWAFAHYVAPAFWVPIAIALLTATAAATTVAVRRLPPDLRLAGAVAAGCVLSLAIAPVDFHYDHVPLALAVVLAVAVGHRPRQVAATVVLGVLAPWLLFFAALAIGGPDSQALSGAVPLLIAALLLLATGGGSPITTASSPAMASTPAKLK